MRLRPSFVHGEVETFLNRQNIKLTSSPPHRQSQNGTVERQWQTAAQMARALLIEARLPRRYWFWAIREAVHRMNILPGRNNRHSKDVTTPFELLYGVLSPIIAPFKWGSVGFFGRATTSKGQKSKFELQTRIGISLGRSNHTNGMIFWDPVTTRFNVSLEYKLDPTMSLDISFPGVQYDGQTATVLVRRGAKSSREPYPPGSPVRVHVVGEYISGIVHSIPLSETDTTYLISFDDVADLYSASVSDLLGLDDPSFTDAKSPDDASPPPNTFSPVPPTMPDWIKDGTHITLMQGDRRRRGFLSPSDSGWSFTQHTGSGRITHTTDLADLPITWQERLTEGSVELGWQTEPRAYHVSAKNLTLGAPLPPPSTNPCNNTMPNAALGWTHTLRRSRD
jgi:hypothetical protein